MCADSTTEAPLITACVTDRGRVREHNEDAYAVHPEIGLWLIADGMGGASSGEVASAIVAESIPQAVRRGEALVDAIAQAHQAILAGMAEGRGGAGMGATAVALRIEGGRYEVAWVGDSRAYAFDGQALRRLSHDHSYVQGLVDQHVIDPAEAEGHPARHILTRVLGGAEPGTVEVDCVEAALQTGQCFLLCSDGLTDELTETEISELLRVQSDPESAAHDLVAAALERGGHDNVTVVLVCPR
ncbi:MAG: SpoIIE family protein phosphatase [Gammaproteobacteria bacterium]|jgi:protein phosphatase|nr:SpoIIE family protein phosphatase [Gammaproteobacteria bacterium]